MLQPSWYVMRAPVIVFGSFLLTWRHQSLKCFLRLTITMGKSLISAIFLAALSQELWYPNQNCLCHLKTKSITFCIPGQFYWRKVEKYANYATERSTSHWPALLCRYHWNECLAITFLVTGDNSSWFPWKGAVFKCIELANTYGSRAIPCTYYGW